MFSRILLKVVLISLCVFIGSPYSDLAKRANVENASSSMGSDFSYQSQYASRSDGEMNLLTGAPAYNVKLYSISTRSGLQYDINLTYNGSVQGEVTKSIDEAPTGLVGLGWHFSPEAIIRDTKGTTDLVDDKFYYIQQDGTISELISLGNNTYKIKGQPYWKVFFSSGYFSIIYADGTKLDFGSTLNSLMYVKYGSSYTDCDDQNTLNYQYNLSTISSPTGSGSITFSYMVSLDAKCRYTNTTTDYDSRYICDYKGSSAGGGVILGYVYGDLRIDRFNCLESGSVSCLREHADYYWSCTELKNTAPELKNSYLQDYYISQVHEKWHYVFPFGGYDLWNVYLTKVKSKKTTEKRMGIFVDRSVLKSIKNDIGTEISFAFGDKDGGEVGVSNVGKNDLVLESTNLFVGGTKRETYQFVYSGDAGQVSHLDIGNGMKKRLLTGITSSLPTGLNLIFEYGRVSNVGRLTKVMNPFSGKVVTIGYGLHSVTGQDGKARFAEVADRIAVSNGTASPDIVTTFSYTNNIAEQDFDLGSGIPYWGKVTATSTSGRVVTCFELNKSNHKFGTRKSVEIYNTESKLVSSETYTYAVQTFAPTTTPWFMPVLIRTTMVKDGVSSSVGTSVCAIDANSGMAKESWALRPDGIALITQRTYAYQQYPSTYDLQGQLVYEGPISKNMLTQVVETKVYNSPDFNAATCALGTAKVVKASHTTWSGASGIWRPSATYAWNYSNCTGLAVGDFIDFSESSPKVNGWQLSVTFDKYDAYGNVIQVSNPLGVSATTIYEPLYNLPVATVANSKAGESFFTSFEDALTPWTSPNSGVLSVATEKRKNGEKSGKMDNSASSEKYLESPVQSIDQPLPSAKKFTFSGWVYTTGPDAEIFFATWSNSPSITYTAGHYANVITPPDAANKWVFLKGELTVAAGSKYFMIRVDNNGKKATGGSSVFFDDLKFYPSNAQMTCTYYDPTWRTPILTVDANENLSHLVTLDGFGRPEKVYEVDKYKDVEETGYKKVLLSEKTYHLMGDDFRLLFPKGGERLVPGQYSIAWSGMIDGGVDVYYDNGFGWSSTPLNGSTPLSNTNSYAWTVSSSLQSNACRIKVQKHGTPAEKVESGTFTITNYLNITSPVAGTTWWTGKINALPWSNNSHPIQWVTAGGSDNNVRIDYWDGFAWRLVVESTPNNGSFDWKPVNGESTIGNCILRISGATTVRESSNFNLYTNQGYVRKRAPFPVK